MAPERSAFTPAQLRVIDRARSPFAVQQYLNGLKYNTESAGPTLRSFRGVVAHKTAQCLEGALSAATILEQHGYPPLLLDLESWDNLDHVLFVYRKRGKWGTVGRSRDPGLHGRKPVFSTLRQLVDSYANPYIDYEGRIIGFGLCDLRDLGGYDWRLSPRNVWKVQRVLIDMPHQKYHMANARYEYWYARYCAYKARFADRKPVYYPGRRTWTAGYPKGKP